MKTSDNVSLDKRLRLCTVKTNILTMTENPRSNDIQGMCSHKSPFNAGDVPTPSLTYILHIIYNLIICDLRHFYKHAVLLILHFQTYRGSMRGGYFHERMIAIANRAFFTFLEAILLIM